MKTYSAERKEALVRRMMPPENALVSALATPGVRLLVVLSDSYRHGPGAVKSG
ncbi:hypothetical protein LJR034_008357 [Caballeronia sp. LjRoot34]|uniref:hypothetical protein n=1 Tax=Caballeronia sp. LjRoot34 TaxID=3342325 RepID=UPI003ED06001